MVRHRWELRTDPSPGRDGGVRFRFRLGRGAIMCLLFTAVIWIAASLLFHPPEGAGDRLGAVAIDPSAATGTTTATGTPEPTAESALPASAGPATSPTSGTGSGAGPPASATPADTLVVHVAGAVKKPGVYRFASGARAGDAVRKAGGLTTAAVASAVNLAAPLQDGQQLYLPTRSEVANSGAAASAAGPSSGTDDDQPRSINVNTADATELEGLPGIGPALSARIIEFRSANGAFSSIEELDAVSGIGPTLMATLQPLVRFR